MTEQESKPTEPVSVDHQRWVLPSVQGAIAPGAGEVSRSKPLTAEELGNVHESAYDEGFNLGRKEGRSKGYQEGVQQAENEFKQKAEILNSIVSVLSEPLKNLDTEVEHSLADMTVLIAKHLVRRELKTNEGEIIAVVRQVMGHLPISARHPRIHLNPDDVELVRDALSIGDDEESWHLESDPLISRGGCLVETETSFIDATVEARLAAIVSKMFGGERDSDGEQDATSAN